MGQDFEAEVVECSLCGEDYSGFGHVCDTAGEMRAALRTAMAAWNLVCLMAQNGRVGAST